MAKALTAGRAVLADRAVVWGRERAELVGALQALAAGENSARLVRGAGSPVGGLGLVFGGQGSQRVGMGLELAQVFDGFGRELDAVAEVLEPLTGWALRDLLADGSGVLDRTGVTQPALFAVEMALACWLNTFGVVPDAVAGHSVGEIAAACVAGVFSLQDAARLVVARGRLMEALPAGGAMTAVQASEQEVLEVLSDPQVSVAAVNGPDAVVVAGTKEAVEAVAAHFTALGRRVRRLQVSHAFHSPLMDPMLDDFREVAESLTYSEPTLPVISNVTGRVAEAGELTCARYWVEHVRRPVRFHDGVRALRERGVGRLVEVGPGGVLTAMARQCLPDDADALLVPVLRKDRSEHDSALAALATLHVSGTRIDWSPLLPGGRRVALPTYPFQHQRYWLQPRGKVAGAADLGLTAADHPLLGATLDLAEADGLVVFTGRLSVKAQPWLMDRPVHSHALVAGSTFLELVLRAGDEVGCGTVAELTVDSPLFVPEVGTVQIQLAVSPADDADHRPFTLHARPDDVAPDTPWRQHAHGTLSATVGPLPDGTPDLTVWPPAGTEADAVSVGTEATTGTVWRRGGDVFAEIMLAPGVEAAGYGLHPAILDGLTDLAAGQQSHMISELRGARLLATAATAVRAHLSGAGRLTLADHRGTPVAFADVLRTAALTPQQLPAPDSAEALFHVDWVRVPAVDPLPTERYAVLGADPLGLVPSLPAARGTTDASETTGVTTALTEFIRDHRAAAETTAEAEAEAEAEAAAAADAEAAAAATHRALATVRSWLAADRSHDVRLVIVTRGAVAARDDEAVTDLTHAPVWGLVRSAQTEHPDRLVLVDVDGSAESLAALPGALATGEPQIALRTGRTYVPRLARTTPNRPAPVPGGVPFVPVGGTVLVTGGTGGLGRLVAR
ncbi:acyltransferase domain-containing protein, partial [Streptomyces sp. NPDC007851]|uniref:acyltransferase domain-containing protein n=1 Tax=Streptomyces sp. NPDC007851 TaxID=3155008 RepID=UPI0033DEABE6